MVQEKLDRVVSSLEESKGEDIRTIDLRGRSPLADFMVIASGRSQRHVSALADHLLTAMKVKNAGNIRVEGLTEGNWVLIDCGDIIVHLFRPEAREFYNLEKIWIIPDIEAPVVKGAGAN
ncbi:ribosome silencing factor [uncultured Bartonella sp.]|uniref:ribosome silencing factor n=1 Tax=uncultured Bartonella sp. TaxID=104108 RepID=UPI00260EEB72|nr:ribosome silencing factor [uncultured Bartonella sp.]